MTLTLRPYQLKAIDQLRGHLAAGHRRALLVAPTGAGKTAIAGEMIRSAVALGSRVLCLAHREELILQLLERIIALGIYPGAIQSDHYKYQPHLPVQVASVQTLVRRPQLPPAKLIIVDEAHRARADTYGSLLDKYKDAVVVGLTASPWRTDGRGLGDLFQASVVAARPRELIDQGFLVPFTGFAYDAPDLQHVAIRGSDYDEHRLELVMSQSTLVGNVVDRYKAHAEGRRAVVFASSVMHSQRLVEQFRAAGLQAEHVDANTPHAERRGILARLRNGTTPVVCNVGILTEGFDLPQLEVAILARPTLSTGLFLQMVGRVMRPACMTCGQYVHPLAETCGCGSRHIKRRALIHDHAACVLNHGQPDQDRDYSLTASRRSALQSAQEPLRTCRKCLAIFVAGPAHCPACGLEILPEQRRALPRQVEGVEVPIEEVKPRARVTNEVVLPFLRQLVETATQKGYRPQWVGMRCKERFGFWPSKEQLRRAGGA
jgi:DNA repair protein RadD